MQVIPSIYISKGKCVSRYKGHAEQSVVIGEPFNIARNFEKQGALNLHIVSVDLYHNEPNRAAVTQIAGKTRLIVSYSEENISISVMGAMFKEDKVKEISLDQSSERFLKTALNEFGNEKISFTIKTMQNTIIQKEGMDFFDYGKFIYEQGATKIICRDIKAEGSFHPNFDEVEKVVFAAPKAKIFAFGGIGSQEDLEILHRAGAYGAIISRAFLERRLPKSLLSVL